MGNLFDIKPHGKSRLSLKSEYIIYFIIYLVVKGEFDILDFRNFLKKIYKKYGDIVRWSIFNQKQVFLFNPDHVKIRTALKQR